MTARRFRWLTRREFVAFAAAMPGHEHTGRENACAHLEKGASRYE